MRVLARNFYAGLRIYDTGEGLDAMRVLTHGTITHGKQFIDPARRGWPTTYYGDLSGVGRAIEALRARGPVKIGVIGLGAGTLAAYGRPGDAVRVYEINPQVIDFALKEFSYLGDSKAQVDVVHGDARLSLEREAPQGFDVLAVDAFSSDSIPVHLLTAEAFEVYFRHLKPGGILAVHISNRYLDLKPVLRKRPPGSAARCASSRTRPTTRRALTARPGCSSPICRRPSSSRRSKAPPGPLASDRSVRLWTDDYSDLFQILK